MSEVEGIKQVHTSCKECVFAVYKDTTQTSCLLGRLDKFREQDKDAVVEAYDDNGKEFFIINGRVCNTFRNINSSWAAAFPVIGNKLAEIESVKDEVSLKVAVFVYLDKDSTPEGIKRTAESLLAQTLRPFQIFFVNNQCTLKASEIAALAMSVLANDITWRIVKIMEVKCERAKALDLAISNLPNPLQSKAVCPTYFAVFNSGFEVQPNFIESINVALNENMDRFRMLTPYAVSPDNGLVCQVMMYKHPEIGGVAPWVGEKGDVITDIVEKITLIAENYNIPHICKKVEDVCLSPA